MDLVAPTWWKVVAPATAIVGGALAYGTLHPRAQLFGPVTFRAPEEPHQPAIALTFAGRLDPRLLPTLLDILERRDAVAAFHVTTPDAHAHPDALRELHRRGHLLTNAGPAPSPAHLVQGYAFWRRAIDAGDDAVADAVGRRPLVFAPPHGVKSPVMLREALWGGHLAVTWARSSCRWLPTRWDQRRLNNAWPNTIVQLPPHRRRTLDTLPTLLDAWAQGGLRPRRLDHLLQIPGYRPDHT